MSTAVRPSRGTLLLYIALFLLFAISATYRVREILDRVDLLRHGTELARAPFDVGFDGSRIEGVEPEAEAAGVRVGDRLQGIAGRPYRGIVDLYQPLRTARAGERINVEVRGEDGRVRQVTVGLQAIRARPLGTQETVEQVVLNAMPPFGILLGFWVAVVRVHDPQAWLFLAMMMSFGEISAGGFLRTWFGRADWFQPIGIFYQQFVSNIWSAAMLLFGVYFSERFVFDRRWPWAKWLVAGPILVGATMSAGTTMLAATSPAVASSIVDWLPERGGVFLLLNMLAIGVFFAAIADKSFRSTNRDTRRRLRLLYAGATASLGPVCIFIIIGLVTGTPFYEMESPLLEFFLFFMILGFPLTMAYVIVVERAMDVRVVIRQGLQYLLASKGVLVLQVVLIAGIILAVASMRVEGTNRPQRITAIAAGVIGVVLIRQFSLRLRTWIDRRFFREAYDAELILSDLATKVRTMVETGPLLETVATRISESLHIPKVAVLLNGGGQLTVAYALGYASPPQVEIAVEDRGKTDRSGSKETAAPPVDTDLLGVLSEAEEHLGAELVLPLSVNEKVLGLLSLGPKLSEEPYSKADVRLLGSVAAQTGLALENSRLTAEVASEVAERAKITREIEIAREVQERLFPQELPAIPGLECAAVCRPALGVGGDYYDFLHLHDGRLGVAIGDVSGKGIPAALLMASLRASLRGQTIQRTDDLAALMNNVSKLVYESSSANRYATFFYAQYEPVTRRLTYVNAGHNPPMIFRGERDVLRLQTGGPVVGLLPMFAYEQSAITLEPGDLFVAFTDGISEAMNAAYEEWGEERLMETVWGLRPRDASAHQIMTGVIASADTFVAGAKQHDDMTIIVARIV
jgi:sigma-B regulation protein RsbU (phosphoserine phosphatase)